MIIEIDDKIFGKDNFEYEIFVNGEKSVYSTNKNGEMSLEANENDIIKIRAKNIVFSSKWGWILSLLYWIVALATGSGENNPFGKPFDAYIQFKTKSSYIKVRANKIWKKKAFEILSGELTVDRNDFVSTRNYKVRWFIGVVLPVNLLLISIIILFFITGAVASSWITMVLFIIPIICIICWNVYVWKVSQALKNNK